MKLLHVIKLLVEKRSEIRALLAREGSQAPTLLHIDWVALREQGIRFVVLDFDGVLSHHDGVELSEEILCCVKKIQSIFGESHVYLHSNNNREDRLGYLSCELPGLQILSPMRKKPDPEGMLSVLRDRRCLGSEVVLVDDRIGTGVLACCLAQTRVVYLTKPCMCFSHSMMKECFFYILRVLEARFLGLSSGK